MLDNSELHRAKADAKDEFYTIRDTIDREMEYHEGAFVGKKVYCNCDDPARSEFASYFRDNFARLGLSELLCTSWVEGGRGRAERFTMDGGRPMADDWELVGDGAFDSDECLDLLGKCDVVVSNPPYSKAGRYLDVVLDSGKDFLLLGRQTWLTMKRMFGPIVSGTVRVGRSITCGSTYFAVPDEYFVPNGKLMMIDGRRCVGVNAIRWFTTFVDDTACVPLKLDSMERNLSVNDCLKAELRKRWGIGFYPKYDNCDAIDVPVVCGIPSDYDGLMGVPVTFLLNHDPNQFELVRMRKGDDGRDLNIDGKSMFTRVLIKRKRAADASR